MSIKNREEHMQDILDAGEKELIEKGAWKETKYPVQYIEKEKFVYYSCSHCNEKYSPERMRHCRYEGKGLVLKEHICANCFRNLEQKECSRQEHCNIFGCLWAQISVVTDHYGVDKITIECRVCRKRTSYIDDD